jgi:acyl transferase domain-containing protein
MATDSPLGRTQAPVAIIGTGCRAPGGVTSAQELWQLLLDRRDAVAGSDPGKRWRDDERVTPADLAGTGMLRSGSFLDDVDLFDPGFFGVPAQEAASVDPQHRLLMETTWEALEDAGVPPRSLSGSRTGLFVGISGADYAKRFTLADFNIYHGISAIPSGAPGRISYILDVNGPSLAVDGACASSLIAVHLACRSLHDGETDFALAGGVTVQLEWGGLVGFARAGALSSLGRCAAFDESADGFVRGEGCGMIALKRLADAQRDGDRVLAVIAGTAVNHAGRVQGVTQPSRSAQRAVMTAAMRAAGISPDAVGAGRTEDQHRSPGERVGRTGPDQGRTRGAARGHPGEPALHPVEPGDRGRGDEVLRAHPDHHVGPGWQAAPRLGVGVRRDRVERPRHRRRGTRRAGAGR